MLNLSLIRDLSETLLAVLLHSLWLGAVLAVFVGAVLRRLPARRAELRYAVALGGLLLLVTGCLAVWSLNQRSLSRAAIEISARESGSGDHPGSDSKYRAAAALAPVPDPHETTADSASPSDRAANSEHALNAVPNSQTDRSTPVFGAFQTVRGNDWLTFFHEQAARFAPWLSGLWLCGVAVMLIRTARALLDCRSLRASSGGVGSGEFAALERLLGELSVQMNLRRAVRLLLSDRVPTPAVLGVLRPVVLIPPALVTGIPLDLWELILAHELAHIRRYDGLVNLAQMLIESLLFFNPAVWWLSRQVRIEREACCDATTARVTGQSIGYARMLLRVADEVSGQRSGRPECDARPATHPVALALALPVADPDKPGELTDRVQRLANPDRAAAPRFTRVGLAAAFLAVASTASALYFGTDFAVRSVADLMTPHERVEALARLQAQQIASFVPPGSSQPTAASGDGALPANGALPDDVATDQPAEPPKINIRVVVKTADGEPLSKHTHLNSYSRDRHSSLGQSLASPREETPEWETTFILRPSQFVVGVSSEGYAPAVSELRTLLGDESEVTVEFVLERGFPTSVQVQSPDGRPIPEATIKLTGKLGFGGGWSSVGSETLRSDSAGATSLEHSGHCEYIVEVRAPGFQHERYYRKLLEGEPLVLTLQPARPTVLRLVDAATGAPVAGAQCAQLAFQNERPGGIGSHMNSDPRSSDPRYWLVLGKSDADGVLHISELRDDAFYTVGILADGFGTVGIGKLRAGQPEQTLHLKPPIRLSGRITGDLSRLRKKWNSDGQYELQYENPLGVDQNNGDLMSATVESDGSFEIQDVVAGFVEFRLPDFAEQQRISVTQSRDDLELAIPEPAAPTGTGTSGTGTSSSGTSRTTPQREVVLRLNGASETGPARGYLQVSWQAGRESQSRRWPITDNAVRLTVPLKTQLRYTPEDVVGYLLETNDQPVEIVAGTGPQIIDIAAQPAGGVLGTIFDADGQPSSRGDVIAFAPRPPRGIERVSDLNPSSRFNGLTYFRTLPFGGRYVLLGRQYDGSQAQWAISEIFRIDGANPIRKLDLHLQRGRPVTFELRDADARPVAGVQVLLTVQFTCDGAKGAHGFTLESRSDAAGRAEFTEALPAGDPGPFDIKPSVVITSAPGCVGRRADLDELDEIHPSTFAISLQRGVSTRGVLIDSDTGRPVPFAKLRVWPKDFAVATFKDNVHTTTDARGEFHFDSLEAVTYYGDVEGASAPGTEVTQHPGGGYSFRYPASFQRPELRGGSPVPVRWKVQLLPNGGLSPLPE